MEGRGLRWEEASSASYSPRGHCSGGTGRRTAEERAEPGSEKCAAAIAATMAMTAAAGEICCLSKAVDSPCLMPMFTFTKPTDNSTKDKSTLWGGDKNNLNLCFCRV